MGLCYSRNTERYRNQGMPWLEKCLLRLSGKLPATENLKTLTLFSCVAFLKNEDFVEFVALQDLWVLLCCIYMESGRQSQQTRCHLSGQEQDGKI